MGITGVNASVSIFILVPILVPGFLGAGGNPPAPKKPGHVYYDSMAPTAPFKPTVGINVSASADAAHRPHFGEQRQINFVVRIFLRRVM